MFNNQSDLNDEIQSTHYGYPNLGRPNDHFSVTPFEAIYVDTKINPHIRLIDDEPTDTEALNGFVLNEVEPWYLGLQNQHLGAKARANYRYTSYRRARSLIVVGNHVTPSTDPGDYSVEANGSLILKAGGEINLKPGVHFNLGSTVHIVPEYEICNDYCNMQQNNGGEANASDEYRTNLSDDKVLRLAKVYPNPSAGSFKVIIPSLDGDFNFSVVNITGKEIKEGKGDTNSFTIDLPQGIYILTVKTYENKTYTHKLIVQ